MECNEVNAIYSSIHAHRRAERIASRFYDVHAHGKQLERKTRLLTMLDAPHSRFLDDVQQILVTASDARVFEVQRKTDIRVILLHHDEPSLLQTRFASKQKRH